MAAHCSTAGGPWRHRALQPRRSCHVCVPPCGSNPLIDLDGKNHARDGAGDFAKRCDGVPVLAAERVIRLWPVRMAG